MGGLTSAVHWWEESQLRVLVLTSMVVQVLLLIFSSLRKFAIPGWVRSITWLAYLAGDAVAIYALATLFNRHKDYHPQGGGGGGSISNSNSNIVSTLEVMWAPVLLLHLGGHDSITAYNIEDNELWGRHLVTAVSQVTVAIYVFCKSWPPDGGDRRLLQAAILLFIPGVIKCFVKPWALKSASIYSLVSSAVVEQNEGEMYPLEQYVKRAKEIVDGDQDRPPRHKEQGNNVVDDVATAASVDDEDHSSSQGLLCAKVLEPIRKRWFDREQIIKRQVKNIQESRNLFEELGKLVNDEETWASVVDEDNFVYRQGRFCAQLLHLVRQESKVRDVIWKRMRVLGEASYELFVDLPSPYPRRLGILKYFWGMNEWSVYGFVERGLATAFFQLYTKLKTAGFYTEMELAEKLKESVIAIVSCRQLILVARVVLPLVSIGLFHHWSRSHSHSHSHSKAHNNEDDNVKVTYAIFCCTAALEICSTLPIWIGSLVGAWPEMVAQYSLIGYYASNRKHSKWMCIAGTFGCKDFVDQRMLSTMKLCCSSAHISILVLGYLKDGWKEEIHDAPSYHRFNDHSTHWPLPLAYRLEEDGCFSSSMRKRRAFDESVLLWHIATDLCFSLSLAVAEHTCHWDCAACQAVRCREMSNYMVYLLFVNPEMLLPGTRRNLFTDAYDGLSHILNDMDMDMDMYMKKPPEVKKDEWVMLQRVVNTMQKRNRSNKASEPCPGAGEEPKKVSPPTEESNKKKAGRSKEKLIDDAWALAQRLLDNNKGDEKKMWKEIQRVWVEMLCFSASRCRGYLHAKALGEGGEFLSYVWFLLFYMGMETFTDKLQRREYEPPSVSHEAGNNANAPPPSTAPPSACEISTDIAAPSSSEVHTGACTAASTSSEICMAEDDMV